ncbi:metal-dependent hydrolase family protein [Neolewinella persica]|uniref:metal-dependent hydrolase family protein n=1 Tax=Neolewinella persica TaxID=70998 RepID=UPI00037B8F23|nr:amidohydrolase family protein [Neolewinella persica]
MLPFQYRPSLLLPTSPASCGPAPEKEAKGIKGERKGPVLPSLGLLIWLLPLFLSSLTPLLGQDCTLIRPARVFDGENFQQGKVVLVLNDQIAAFDTEKNMDVPAGCTTVDYPDGTLLPGMIEGHSHLLLHPYNETDWNDQVLKESYAERAIRGGIHAEKTVRAGFTTVRDLGSEGAGYVDVGLKETIEKGVIQGPRMIVAGKAMVTTGSYGPKGFADHVTVPLGAETADGLDELTRVVRDQIGRGADVIKVYADYRWGANKMAMPTYTQRELELVVEIANSSGRQVVAHAATAEGMRRAVMAGVATIEHGDGGTREVFELMKKHGVALCPTLAAGDAIEQYKGWKKGVDPDTDRIVNKQKSFALALEVGVTIAAGGDVGVFPHGDNARELEMMVDYGMTPLAVLRSVTAGNAAVFELADRGQIKPGLLADLVVVQGNPQAEISALRKVRAVFKGGVLVR